MENNPPHFWIDSFHRLTKKVNNDNVQILTLFKDLFFNTYGINLTETKNNELGKRLNEPTQHILHSKRAESFYKILDYLLPELVSKVSNEQIAEMYNSFLRLNDIKLINLMNKHIPFEDFLIKLEDGILKESIMIKLGEPKFRVNSITKYTNDEGENLRPYTNWGEWRINTQKEMLEKSLTSNNTKNKKMKV